MGAQVSNTHKNTPLFCPVCETAMVGKNDPSYFRLFECCEDCGLDWAERNRPDWLAGWRPNRELVNEQINKRRLLIRNEILRLRGN
jgi:hypothetical protein